MHLKNSWNDYAEALGMNLFDEIPKSVLAAIAVSAMTAGGDYIEHAAARVAKEWQILHLNGIVPQKPGKIAKQTIVSAPAEV